MKIILDYLLKLPVKVGMLTSCCGSSRSSFPPLEQNKNAWRYQIFWITELSILKNRWSGKIGSPNMEAPLIPLGTKAPRHKGRHLYHYFL